MLDSELKGFLGDVGWTGFGISVAMALDFIFHLAVGRTLGPADFGLYGVLISIYYITVQSPSSIIEVASRKIKKEKAEVFRQLGFKTLFFGAFMFLASVSLTPFISDILGISVGTYLFFCLVFPLAYFRPVAVGHLQEAGRFREYAYYEVAGSSFKFVAIFLVLAGLGLIGAISAYVMEIFAGFLLLYYFLRPKISRSTFDHYGIFIKSSIIVVSFFLVFNIDILLLKIFKTSRIVGLYTSISVFGKALVFGSGTVVKASFSKFGNEGDSKILVSSLALILAGGILSAFLFLVAGGTIIGLSYGSGYAEAASFAPLYLVFMTLVGACGLLGNYHLARDSSGVNLMLLMPIIQVSLILFFHRTVYQFIYAGIVSTSIVALMLFAPVLYRYRDRALRFPADRFSFRGT